LLSACTTDEAKLANRLLPTVVELVTIDDNFTFCSGVAYSPTRVITSKHCIREDRPYKIRDSKYQLYDVTFTKKSSITDAAVLHIPSANLPSAVVSSADTLEIGDPIMVVGHPRGAFSYTVSFGRISHLTDLLNGIDHPIFSHTAPIYFGMSGGPIFNMRGEIVGITRSFIQGAVMIGIPIDDVKELMND
jgi:S1-C subfamily serine protease